MRIQDSEFMPQGHSHATTQPRLLLLNEGFGINSDSRILKLDFVRKNAQNPPPVKMYSRNNHVANFKNITVTELVTMLQQDGLKLIDVRTDAEIARGKIPQGDALPLHLLPLRLSEMDKNATTVFYCHVGGRSAQAAAFAAGNGFTDVYNLQGGITAWAHAGQPIS